MFFRMGSFGKISQSVHQNNTKARAQEQLQAKLYTCTLAHTHTHTHTHTRIHIYTHIRVRLQMNCSAHIVMLASALLLMAALQGAGAFSLAGLCVSTGNRLPAAKLLQLRSRSRSKIILCQVSVCMRSVCVCDRNSPTSFSLCVICVC